MTKRELDGQLFWLTAAGKQVRGLIIKKHPADRWLVGHPSRPMVGAAVNGDIFAQHRQRL